MDSLSQLPNQRLEDSFCGVWPAPMTQPEMVFGFSAGFWGRKHCDNDKADFFLMYLGLILYEFVIPVMMLSRRRYGNVVSLKMFGKSQRETLVGCLEVQGQLECPS